MVLDIEAPINRSSMIWFSSAFFVAGGFGPILQLFGYTHPGWGILGALIGAGAGAFETWRIGRRIEREANAAGMRATVGFYG